LKTQTQEITSTYLNHTHNDFITLKSTNKRVKLQQQAQLKKKKKRKKELQKNTEKHGTYKKHTN